MESLLWPAINLIIFCGILFYYTKAPIKDFVVNRHNTLDKEIREVRTQLVSSQNKYDEFSSKLKAIDVELGSISDTFKKNADLMKVKLTEEAGKSSKSLIQDAKERADSAFDDLRADLSAEIGILIMKEAEAKIRGSLTGDDRVRIRKEFTSAMEGA